MKKKVLLIVIPIVVLLVIGVAIAVLYFTTDLFKSPSELFWEYFAQAESAMNILENDNWTSQNSLKANNSYTSNGQLALTISQGENSSKILNIETTARHDANNGRTYADATLKNGDIDLFQVSYINSGDVINFTRRKDRYIASRDILIGAVYNLQILDNKINTIIQINKNAYIPDTYNNYYSLVKLINYGNLSVSPYKIWDDTLDWINDHLGQYLEEFLEE